MYRYVLLPFCLGTGLLHGQAVSGLPEVVVSSPRVANPAPADTFAMPVSVLRYEPLLDVQGRNMAEGQADVIIRGGIFENTGFRIGSSTLLDPQTGHYLAEIPVAPAMLGAPTILTGGESALAGTNVTVGTVAYDWRPVTPMGRLVIGVGTHDLQHGEFYQGGVKPLANGLTLAADVDYARSSGDGTVRYGDHDFQRVGGRVQLRTAQSQTDLYAGYQAKFFGWPNLYTPFGVYETENLQTTLAMLNHRVTRSAGGYFEAGAYYRRNKDDYEYNRLISGQYNPYQHESVVRGLAVEGREVRGDWFARYRAELVADHLDSTSLTAGRYHAREIYKVAAATGREWSDRYGGGWIGQIGATWDDTNREGGAVSPIAEVTRKFPAGGDWQSVTLGYSEATQVPTYTALNSSATSGLFRGNPNLGRETSRNLELSTIAQLAGWQVTAALFQRRDDGLVDWTYRAGVTARTANAVDIRTDGFELVARRDFARVNVVLGYTALTKAADYGSANVDASFYALNYARHRLTAAITWQMAPGWELRMDNDARIQADNALRTAGGNRAWRTALAVAWRPAALPRLELVLQADNLWDSDYQEVPAVPASGRQVSLSAGYRW